MKSKNEFKKIDIKRRVCYYLDDTINDTEINFKNISLDKKSYENTSVSKKLYKTPASAKPLPVRFSKIDGFIISFDGEIKHLVLLDYKYFNKICDKIQFLIRKKVILKIILIIILDRSELIQLISKSFWRGKKNKKNASIIVIGFIGFCEVLGKGEYIGKN